MIFFFSIGAAQIGQYSRAPFVAESICMGGAVSTRESVMNDRSACDDLLGKQKTA